MGWKAGQSFIDRLRGKEKDNVGDAGSQYGDLMSQALAAQGATLPEIYAMESEWRPRMAEVEMATLERLLPRQLDLYRKIMPAMTALETASTAETREAELRDIQRFGPQLQAAVDRLRPRQAQMMSLLDEQAIAGLKAPGQLSPHQKRMAQQNVHEIFGRTGMSGYGPSEGMMEAELTRRLSMDMEDRNRRFAQQQMQIGAATQLDIPQFLTGRVSRTPINIAPGVFSQTQGMSPGPVTNSESQMLMDLAALNTGVGMYNAGQRGSRYQPFMRGSYGYNRISGPNP